jgi:hypothetical protein
MSTPAPSLNENYGLASYVAAAMESVKALHLMITALTTDVAALRRTMLEEPGFAISYEEHLKVAVSSAKPLLQEAMKVYDKIIDGAESVGHIKQ